ncbi:MAG: hypothetical protein KDK38_14940 [Leptospiraceae bacterium]|nr:hypothetical protein [Leptospiraceae bacterium]
MALGKKTTKSGSGNLSTRPLKINHGKPLSEAFLNNFFKVFSADQILEFEEFFSNSEAKLKAIGIGPDEFMKHVRDSYTRYQDHKGLDSFMPMDSKGLKYVLEFLSKSFDTIYEAKKSGRLNSR